MPTRDQKGEITGKTAPANHKWWGWDANGYAKSVDDDGNERYEGPHRDGSLIYVSQHGNDDTAEVGNRMWPFGTMQAAVDAIQFDIQGIVLLDIVKLEGTVTITTGTKIIIQQRGYIIYGPEEPMFVIGTNTEVVFSDGSMQSNSGNIIEIEGTNTRVTFKDYGEIFTDKSVIKEHNTDQRPANFLNVRSIMCSQILGFESDSSVAGPLNVSDCGGIICTHIITPQVKVSELLIAFVTNLRCSQEVLKFRFEDANASVTLRSVRIYNTDDNYDGIVIQTDTDNVADLGELSLNDCVIIVEGDAKSINAENLDGSAISKERQITYVNVKASLSEHSSITNKITGESILVDEAVKNLF